MHFGTVLSHEGMDGRIVFRDGTERTFDVLHAPQESLEGCAIGVLQPDDVDFHRGEFGRLREAYQPQREPTEAPTLWGRLARILGRR